MSNIDMIRIGDVDYIRKDYREKGIRYWVIEQSFYHILSHPNIMKLADVSYDDLSIIMPQGIPLKRWLLENSMTENMARRFIFELISAVVYLQHNDIHHGDLHIGNIIILDGVITIIDFEQAVYIPYTSNPEIYRSLYSNDILALGDLVYHILRGEYTEEYLNERTIRELSISDTIRNMLRMFMNKYPLVEILQSTWFNGYIYSPDKINIDTVEIDTQGQGYLGITQKIHRVDSSIGDITIYYATKLWKRMYTMEKSLYQLSEEERTIHILACTLCIQYMTDNQILSPVLESLASHLVPRVLQYLGTAIVE